MSLWNVRNLRLQTQTAIVSGDPFGVLRQEARLRGVIATLPAVSQVGYLAGPGLDALTAEENLLGARYAFAPRMLVLQKDSPQQLVIGDFAGPVDLDALASMYRLRVVRDFGNGIVLFERNGGQ